MSHLHLLLGRRGLSADNVLVQTGRAKQNAFARYHLLQFSEMHQDSGAHRLNELVDVAFDSIQTDWIVENVEA